MKKYMVAFLLFTCSQANALPIQWTSTSGGNDHWYDVITTGKITWSDARQSAINLGGHLATITSSSENDFIFDNLVDNASLWSQGYQAAQLGPWLGGFQSDPSVPASSGWEWVTGEAWNYTNWHSGEPNDSNGTESYLHYFGYFGISSLWNDLPNDGSNYGDHSPIAFVIEYTHHPSSVPEPSIVWLLSAGLVGLGVFRHRRFRN